jgi:hypothetical protein
MLCAERRWTDGPTPGGVEGVRNMQIDVPARNFLPEGLLGGKAVAKYE